MAPQLSRRTLLKTGVAAAAIAATGQGRAAAAVRSPASAPDPTRPPGSVPDPTRPPGVPDPAIPVDHVVVVMMENHSFDNYLGMLPGVDGFRLDAAGRPLATNPTSGGVIRAFRMPSACQMESEPRQDWNGTHIEIDGGRMDGFVRASGDVAMGYWQEADLPFYYSLARTYCVANRWFASAPGQTYPNRRYLMAATSYGLVATITPGPNDPPPPNGTIFDRLNHYGVSWTNYFTDLPQTAIIPAVLKANPTHLAPIAQFYADCSTGNLPALSLVDPDFGLADVAGGLVPGQPVPQTVRAVGQDEENPQNIDLGEQFVSAVVQAVTTSPAWPRTVLVWLYDEHGGYYDHVPPPPAILPDAIPPDLHPGDIPGRFDRYGVRVPAVVVSPWARPGGVSNVVHDHTSVLAFVERKWNLPACTARDANAAGLSDLLDFSRPRLLDPPPLAAPADPVVAQQTCSTADPHRPVEVLPSGVAQGVPAGTVAPNPPPALPATGPPGLIAGLGATALATGIAGSALRRRHPGADPQRDGQAT